MSALEQSTYSNRGLVFVSSQFFYRAVSQKITLVTKRLVGRKSKKICLPFMRFPKEKKEWVVNSFERNRIQVGRTQGV